jgi:hypothetical protein
VSQAGTTGQLYATGGQQFDNNDYYLVSDAAALDVGGALTMEGWFNLDAALPATTWLMYRLNSYYMSVTDTGRLTAALYPGAAAKYSYKAAAVAAGGWHHIAAAWARPQDYVNLYVDGINVGRTSTVPPGDADIDPTANPYRIGYTSNSIVGHADEVRLSNVARSANWLLTQYRNQSSPQTFVTVTEVLPYEYCPWFAYDRVGFGAGRLR